MRTILHVDFDSFFASCEQHFNPRLRGIPIGVTAENGRTCIISSSREAKKFGIKTASRTYEALRLCPGIVFVKADFEKYLEITKKLVQIANCYSSIVELFSLDEVFLDLTPVKNLYPSTLAVVKDLKKRIREEISPTITVSMGCSYNKLLAKLATSLNKPDGFAVIDDSNKDKILSKIELTDIMGIGSGYKRRLNTLGIFNLTDLQNCPVHILRAEFGDVASQNLRAISFGIDDLPVVSYTEDVETKSVGRQFCLPENNYDSEQVLKIICELCEEIAIKLRKLNMKGKTIGLYLHGDKSRGARKSTTGYTNLGQDIFKVCLVFYKEWKPQYVRQISVWVGSLVAEQYATIPLFESPKKEAIARVADAINDRFGHHTIRKGYLAYAPKLTTRPNGYLADRWHRKKIQHLFPAETPRNTFGVSYDCT